MSNKLKRKDDDERQNKKGKQYYKDKSANHYRREQPRKDSSDKRVNLDNERIQKYEEDSKRKPDANDVSWYSKNPELMRSAAQIPFASVLGAPIVWPNSTTVWNEQTVTGVMGINWAPSVGTPGIGKNLYPYALNQAGKNIYSFLVHANSRDYKYEYQDLTILILAGMQPFLLLASMRRAYGVMKYYQERNWYMPSGLVRAMGFDAEDLRKNLGRMWFQLNDMVLQTRQIWIPNVMPILERWFWLNSLVYTDSETSNFAQCYVFNQHNYFMYDETTVNTGGALVPLKIQRGGSGDKTEFLPGSHVYAWDDWVRAFDACMSALLNSEDRGIIFGDILNAYGPSSIYSLGEIPADYVVAPTYNSEVLTQIENSTSCGMYTTSIFQTTDGLVPQWSNVVDNGEWNVSDDAKYQAYIVTTPGRSIVNFHFAEQPTPEQITVATRLTALGCYVNYTPAITTGNDIRLDEPRPVPITCGSETVVYVSLVDIISNTVDQRREVQRSYLHPVYDSKLTGDVNVPNVPLWEKWASFDWAPALYDMNVNTAIRPTTSKWIYNQSSTEVRRAALDFDNYAQIDSNTLDKIHTMCLYSLFGVPQM